MTTTTFTGAIDNNWFTAGNWDNGVPTSTVDAVFNGSSPSCDATGAASFLSLDFTGYTASFTASDLHAYGNVTLDAGASIYIDALTYHASGTLTTDGIPAVPLTSGLNYVAIDAGSLTIMDNSELCQLYSYGSASVSTYERTITFKSGSVISTASAPVTWIQGGKFIFSGDSANILADALPPVVVTGAVAVTVQNLICSSYTQTGGSLLFDGSGTSVSANMTLTNVTSVTATFDYTVAVGGNFFADNCTLDGTGFAFTFNVTGKAFASDSTITYATFSGAALDASDSCTNGGGNTNVVFTAQTTTWTGSIDTDWNTAGNWTNGVPTALTHAVINGSAPGDVIFTTGPQPEFKSLTCTGFTGLLDINSYNGPITYGDITLGAGMTMDFVNIAIYRNCTITTNGVAVPGLQIGGQNFFDVTATLGDNLTTAGEDITVNARSTLAMGNKTVTFNNNGQRDVGMRLSGGYDGEGTITWTTGAKIAAVGDEGSYFEVQGGDPDMVWPPIETSGDVFIYFNGFSSYPTGMEPSVNFVPKFTSFSVTDGGMFFDYVPELHVLGNVTAVDATFTDNYNESPFPPGMSGNKLTVDGDFSFTNGDLVNGVIEVGGLADFIGTGTITDMVFSGETLYAPNGIDGDGNTNVVFAARSGGFTPPARSGNRGTDGKKRVSVDKRGKSQQGHYGETSIELSQF
jgi:hypothetical protein